MNFQVLLSEWRYKGAVADFFGAEIDMAVPKDLEELLEAGAHFGHQVRRWNPKMAPYIYSTRDGVHVFDLTITAKLLDAACEYVEDQASKGKKIVFLGTKRQAKPIVKEEAMRVGAPYIVERWLGGTITNWDEISKRINKLNEMKEKREKGEYAKYTKKEQSLIDRDIARLERFFGGIADFKQPPEILFVVDVIKEKVAVTEAVLRGVPVVAMVDTNADPTDVIHPIPANDDAVRSIKYIVSRIADAYGAGAARASKNQVHPLYRKDENPAVRPAVGPAVKPATAPVAKPVAKPEAKPVAKAEIKPVEKPAAKALPKKATKPAVKTASKSAKAGKKKTA